MVVKESSDMHWYIWKKNQLFNEIMCHCLKKYLTQNLCPKTGQLWYPNFSIIDDFFIKSWSLHFYQILCHCLKKLIKSHLIFDRNLWSKTGQLWYPNFSIIHELCIKSWSLHFSGIKTYVKESIVADFHKL